ncbi:MAG: ExbD/TolR family protein [Spirulinaceae cyanobacterium]
MRFRNHQTSAKIPKIDLIPMLTVMMGVLGFFVVMSTLLATPPDRVEVTVPDGEAQQDATGAPDNAALVVRLQGETQALIEGEALNQAQVLSKVAEFIRTNEQDPVMLVAAPQVPYDIVVQWLTAMRQTGGERVALGIDYGGDGVAP